MCSGCMGFGFRVWGIGLAFEVKGLALSFGLRFWVQLEFWVSGVGFGLYGLGSAFMI